VGTQKKLEVSLDLGFAHPAGLSESGSFGLLNRVSRVRVLPGAPDNPINSSLLRYFSQSIFQFFPTLLRGYRKIPIVKPDFRQ